MKRRTLLLTPVACMAQLGLQQVTGKWAARMGAREFGGTFTAEPFKDPMDAGGLWQLVDERGEIALSGDWSARKRENAWDGGWWSKTARGAEYTGGWTAKSRIAANLPMMELFVSASKDSISGTWTSDNGRRGTWTIWVGGE